MKDLMPGLSEICVPRQHRRCARSSSRRTRPRVHKKKLALPSSSADLWCLPDEMLMELLMKLHIKDLLSVRSSHPYLRDLIDNNSSSLWSTVSFQDVWPSQFNLRHFEKAAKYENIDALVKLGIAYLYNEGLPGDFEGEQIIRNGVQAAKYFCSLECATPRSTAPFTWLFIRPPWATTGVCCKECVYNNMKLFVLEKELCDRMNTPNVLVCIVKTRLSLDDVLHEDDSDFLEKAVQQQSPVGAFIKWQQQFHAKEPGRCDANHVLESVRALREVVQLGDEDGMLTLCNYYVRGLHAGISYAKANAYVRDIVQRSQPTNIHTIYGYTELTHAMRYILMDWLVEVSHLKGFNERTLHVAIDVVDRFMKARHTTRSMLQLLGVSAMVLCSRYFGQDIMTIREAVWLTDNTYKYEDVVRMMGEITATLKGKIRCVTTLDYAELLGLAACNDLIGMFMVHYINELILMHSELAMYTQAQLAASAVLLGRLTLHEEEPWPKSLADYSGFTMENVALITLHVHHRCFIEPRQLDHRNVELQAVQVRFAEEAYLKVSSYLMLSTSELKALLGLERPLPVPLSVNPRSSSPSHHLIMSPSRNSKAPGTSQHQSTAKPAEMSLEREQAATPTLDSSFSEIFPNVNDESALNLNESFLSGYEGDRDDDSIMDANHVDGDPDLESLWCGDHGFQAARVEATYETTAGDSGLSDRPDPEGFSFLNHTASFTCRQEPRFEVIPCDNDSQTDCDFHVSSASSFKRVEADSAAISPPAGSSVFSLSSMQSRAFIVNDSAVSSLMKHSPAQDSGIDMFNSPSNLRLSVTRTNSSTPRPRRSRRSSEGLPLSMDLGTITEDDETIGLAGQQIEEEVDITPVYSSTPAKPAPRPSGTDERMQEFSRRTATQRTNGLSQRNPNVPSAVKRKSVQTLGNETKTRVIN